MKSRFLIVAPVVAVVVLMLFVVLMTGTAVIAVGEFVGHPLRAELPGVTVLVVLAVANGVAAIAWFNDWRWEWPLVTGALALTLLASIAEEVLRGDGTFGFSLITVAAIVGLTALASLFPFCDELRQRAELESVR